MANAYHLKRLSLLVGKLSGKYVPQEELLKYVESQIAASFPSSTGYLLRTICVSVRGLSDIAPLSGHQLIFLLFGPHQLPLCVSKQCISDARHNG